MTTTTTSGAVSLDAISLRHKERGLIVGGTDAGKSYLADRLGADFVHRYRGRGGRRLILDSKPRYRAQRTVQGAPAARRYRGWQHGPVIPDSVVVDDPRDLDLAWRTGARTVIMQCESRREVGRLMAGAEVFLASSRANRPQLLQVDETGDFYHGNGAPIGANDVLERAARAGRERGTACLFGNQRTKGMAEPIKSQVTKIYLMRLDAKPDVKALYEMGMPRAPFEITDPQIFWYWTKTAYAQIFGPYRIMSP